MMEGCNTGLQTSNILLDTHFPGSTPLGQIHQSTSSQVDVDETCPDTDTESLQATWGLFTNYVMLLRWVGGW